jgi:RNA polymerase sigma factor (sigma-70 family)
MRTQRDERLVALARDGHDAAFEEIVRRYRPPLLAFASAYVAADVAEDVVQESLENSWKSLLKSESDINLKPWLYAIVRNRALNAKRDARTHDPVDDQLAGSRTPQEIVLERDQLNSVLAAVAALAPAQRRALVASAFEGRTHDQIAAALDTSPASVRGLIHRARGSVRDGVGLLLPFPLVRAISELASDPATADAAVAAAAAGLAGAGVGAGAAAGGGGVATKAATVVAAATVAAGGGVALEQSLRDDDRRAVAVSKAPEDRADRRGERGDRASSPVAANASSSVNDGANAAADPRGGESQRGNSGPGGSAEDERDEESAERLQDAREEAADAARDDTEELRQEQEQLAEDAEDAAEDRADELDDAADDAADEQDGGSSGSGSTSSGSGSGGDELDFEDFDGDSSGSGSG